jgi:choline transport protein
MISSCNRHQTDLVARFPIFEIWMQATRSHPAATLFMVVLLIAGVVALIAIQQTASRLTWSFARDDALVGSGYLGRIHPSLQVPVWSLIANNAIVFIIGCIFLGSSTAFNAFIGTGLILGQVTYAIPAALLMFRKRSEHFLPKKRSFRLPGICGWIANALTVGFAVIVLVFYNFPVALPVTGSNMSGSDLLLKGAHTDESDYTPAVIGVMAIFAALNWFLYTRKRYHGPRLAAQ